MTLSNKNLFVKLYVYVNHEDPTNLCGLFWFSIFAVIIPPALLAIVVGIIALFVLFILNFSLIILLKVLGIILVSVASYLAIVGIIYLAIKAIPDNVGNTISEKAQNLGDIIAVVKNKYCPMITIVDKDHPLKVVKS